MHQINREKIQNRPVADLHMHCIPGVDDGAVDLKMALELLQMSYDQGVRVIFCTSHDTGYDPATRIAYPKEEYVKLKEAAEAVFPDLTLYLGSEVFCIPYFMDEIVDRFWVGEYPTINRTRYVLIEFPTWGIKVDEMKFCINRLTESGFKIIIAHPERYYEVTDGIPTIQEFKEMGCQVQMNTFSLVDNRWPGVQNLAYAMLDQQLVDFIGTDAHRTTHRPPIVIPAVEEIYKRCDEEYADAICWGNIRRLIER